MEPAGNGDRRPGLWHDMALALLETRRFMMDAIKILRKRQTQRAGAAIASDSAGLFVISGTFIGEMAVECGLITG